MKTKVDSLIFSLLSREPVEVVYVGSNRLKGGATRGVLQATSNNGRTWHVLIDGYKRPLAFDTVFWEIV